MAQIDYYLAVQSPYVYLAGTRPAEIAAAPSKAPARKPSGQRSDGADEA